MKTIKNINLVNIIKDECGRADADFEHRTHKDGSESFVTTCVLPTHDDSTPSFVVRELNGKWEYKCFGCGDHGDAQKLVVKLKKCDNLEEAKEYLGNKYKVFYPQQVTLEYFCEDKGFDLDFVKDLGWENTSQGVAIPFYSIDGTLIARKIRCKYTGKNKYFYDTDVVNGVQNPIYGLERLVTYDRTKTLYLTEGETDCATLLQAGFQALGIPGSQAFSPEDIKYFVDFEDVVLIRDDDAAGLHLVKDIAERLKTLKVIWMRGLYKDVNQLCSEAYLGNKEGFVAAVGGFSRLPATKLMFKSMVANREIEPQSDMAWMLMSQLYNPTDIDMMAEEIASMYKVGKKVIKEAAQSAKKRVLEGGDVGALRIEDYCYWKTVIAQGIFQDIQVTNFIVQVASITVSEDIKTYHVHFVNQEGYPSSETELTGEILANKQRFKEVLFSKGNYVFNVPPTDSDFNEITKLITSAKDVPVIIEPQYIGAVSKSEWLFGNCGVDKDGKVVEADENGIVELSGKKYRPLAINQEENDEEVIISELPTFKAGEIGTDYKRNLAQKSKASLGSYGAWTALGWVVASWFSNSIFYRYNDAHFYPFLFVHGKKSSGKSTFCRLLYKAFGFNSEAKPFGASTPVAIGRLMGYNSSIPVWLDDYRTDIRDIEQKNNMLLGFYNRQGRAVGTRSGFGIRSNQVRAVLLLSGEHKISDAAALSRCVEVTVSDTLRGSRSDLSEFTALARMLPSYSLTILQKVNQQSEVDRLFSCIKAVEDRLLKSVTDDRIAVNTAIFAGAFLYEFGGVLSDKEKEEYLAFLCGEVSNEKKDQDDSSMVQEFLTDLNYVFENRGSEFTKTYAKIATIGGSMGVCLRLKECVIAVNETLHRQYQNTTLRSYFNNEPSVVDRNKAVKFSGKAQKSIVFDLSKFKHCGDSYSSLADTIDSYCNSDDTLEGGKEY